MTITPGGAAVFCDHNAGGPAATEVLERFLAVERECPGNPASQHAPGRRSRAVLEHARQQIADAFAVAAVDVVFTSGGTEAANLAVLGLGEPSRPVQVSPAEHPAVRHRLGAADEDVVGGHVVCDLGVGLQAGLCTAGGLEVQHLQEVGDRVRQTVGTMGGKLVGAHPSRLTPDEHPLSARGRPGRPRE